MQSGWEMLAWLWPRLSWDSDRCLPARPVLPRGEQAGEGGGGWQVGPARGSDVLCVICPVLSGICISPLVGVGVGALDFCGSFTAAEVGWN